MIFKSVKTGVIFCLLLAAAVQAEVIVEMDTSMGSMHIELYADEAPNTVRNFIRYIEINYYDDLIFHRVIDNWIIQSGGYDRELLAGETLAPIRNEATNGLKNTRGTIAMARAADPHSAESQFFINLRDNPSFDHRARTLNDYGYCVFGKVISGMDVADSIGRVKTHEQDGFEDLPFEPVVIRSVRLITDTREENQ